MNLLQFQAKFATEEACLAHLELSRWGKDGKDRCCPHCGSVKTYKFKDGKLFKCGDCRKQFTVKVGTIFSDSKLPLYKWYMAIYLASSLKNGISSVQLSKYISVKQASAWFMLHRIRAAFENTGRGYMLGSTGKPVEVDETFYGKHVSKANKSNKSKLLGMVERGGEARVKHVRSIGARVLLPEIGANIHPGSTVYTDGAQVYATLNKRGYWHEAVNHSAGEYVRGQVTTNSVEGFWSCFKRSVYGTYHFVSPKHVDRYAQESAFRYNTRTLTDGERFEKWFGQVVCRLKYRELVGK